MNFNDRVSIDLADNGVAQVRFTRGDKMNALDPAQFEAALLNLIVNARDALGDVTGGPMRDGAPMGAPPAAQVREGARITVQTMTCSVEPGQVAELAPGD